MTVIKAWWKLVKWSFRALLFLIGASPLFRCSSGYKTEDGKVTFDGEVITDKSFIVLSDEFAKDSTSAYYKRYPIPSTDLSTFTAVDEHYAKDNNKVYYCNEYREGQNYYLTKRSTILILHNANPQKFTSLGHGYAADGMHAWFEGTAFKVKDLASLKSMNSQFVKDDVQAYYNRKPVVGSDGKTFQTINSEYAKDTAHIYFYGFIGVAHSEIYAIPCDKATFEILDYPYSKDKTAVFFQGRKIKNAHAPSFKILGHGYGVDEHAVYYETTTLKDAHPAHFAPLKENDSTISDYRYAKDDQSVFLDQTKIKEADVSSFKILSLGYSVDSHHVYYKTKIVAGALPESFKTYQHGYGDADAEDSKHTYLEGEVVIVTP